jgi:hypothetical protein
MTSNPSTGNTVPASSQIYHPSYLPPPPCHIVTPACTVATNVVNKPAESISPTNHIQHSSTSISTKSTNNVNYQHELNSPPKKKNSYHQKEGRIHIGASVYARIGEYIVDNNPKHKRRSKAKVDGVVVSSHLPNEWLVSFVNGQTKVMKSTQLFLHQGGKDPPPPKESKDEEPFISSPPAFSFCSPMSRIDKMIDDSDNNESHLPTKKKAKKPKPNSKSKPTRKSVDATVDNDDDDQDWLVQRCESSVNSNDDDDIDDDVDDDIHEFKLKLDTFNS